MKSLKKYIHENGVGLLNFPVLFQEHQEKNLEEKFDEGCEKISTPDYVPKVESDKPNVWNQE